LERVALPVDNWRFTPLEFWILEVWGMPATTDKQKGKTVFVFGAGFTKAYLPNAPVMTDNYDDGWVEKNFDKDSYARILVEVEKERNPEGKINIERLMSRLDAGMPIDSWHGAKAALDYVLDELHSAFFRRLAAAQNNQPHQGALLAFAKMTVVMRYDCITFNYDDVLDWALSNPWDEVHPENRYWHPHDGYAFICPAHGDHAGSYLHTSSMHLIKLHGSVNWRRKLGRESPIDPEDIVRIDGWLRNRLGWVSPLQSHDLAEQMPYFVAPVLMKSSIMRDPLLKLLWIKAHRSLAASERVIFVGYSMPDTDIAAKFLFLESIPPGTPIDAVVLPKDKDEEDRIRRAYKTLFWAKDPNVIIKDAREWLEESFVKGTQFDPSRSR
jgi:hypothetical protein